VRKKKTVLVLGGGRHQIDLIKYAEENNVEVVLSDYLPYSPGHKIATYSTLTSTLDVESNILLAKEYCVDGVITSGTDQPLNTMAQVTHGMKLPCYLSKESAHLCTNKLSMFEVLSQNGCDIPKYRIIINQQYDRSDIDNFEYPLIVKPVDSQGQRGISIVDANYELSDAIELASNVSKENKCIVQEYVSGPEITISAWIHKGDPKILLVTDRITYNKDEAVGVCFQHTYPSRLSSEYLDHIHQTCTNIMKAYNINDGPLYVQCIFSENQLKIVEATCRIGGGHEDQLIKEVTGINIYPLLLELALKGSLDSFPTVPPYPIREKFALVNFLLAKPGTFTYSNLNNIYAANTNVVAGDIYHPMGYKQDKIINSLGRIGYYICKSSVDKSDLNAQTQVIYEKLIVSDTNDANLVFWPSSKYLNE